MAAPTAAKTATKALPTPATALAAPPVELVDPPLEVALLSRLCANPLGHCLICSQRSTWPRSMGELTIPMA